MQLTYTFGILKNIAVTSEELERAMAGKIAFDSSAVDGVVSNTNRISFSGRIYPPSWYFPGDPAMNTAADSNYQRLF